MTRSTDSKPTQTKSRSAKLFHAVVLVGAGLVSGPAGAPAETTTTLEAGSAATQSLAASPGTCPPGSERPYPPCYWIK